MKILTLNCQKNYRPEEFSSFLLRLLLDEDYDFLLFQEASAPVKKILRESGHAYSLLEVFNADIDAESELCILYRNKFNLEEKKFISFAHFPENGKRPEFGLLLGKFKIPGKSYLIIGTLHLDPGLRFAIRRKETAIIKKILLKWNPHDLPCIFAGDFNSGPGEEFINDKLLKPQFINATKKLGMTWDASYCEPVVFLNRLGLWLAKTGINIKFKADHIYINKKIAERKFTAGILPDRVSDHNAVEIRLIN